MPIAPELSDEKILVQEISNARLVLSTQHAQVLKGNNKVYEISFIEGTPETDMGKTTKLSIELPLKVTHFNLIDNELKEKVLVARLCNCIDPGYHKLSDGKIKMESSGEDSLSFSINIEFIGNESGKKYSLIRSFILARNKLMKQNLDSYNGLTNFESKVLYNKGILDETPGNIKIIDSKSTLIELSRKTGPSPETDMGFYEKIYIKLPELNKDFTIQGNDFKQNIAYYGRLCRCINSGYNNVRSGVIEGRRNKSGNWNLSIDINAFGRHDSAIYNINQNFEINIDPNRLSTNETLNLSYSELKSYPNDQFDLLECLIEDNNLICKVKYSGGCSGANFMLFCPETETTNQRLSLSLRLDDKDHCRSIVTKSLSFDLSPLKNSKKGPVEIFVNESFSLPYIIR